MSSREEDAWAGHCAHWPLDMSMSQVCHGQVPRYAVNIHNGDVEDEEGCRHRIRLPSICNIFESGSFPLNRRRIERSFNILLHDYFHQYLLPRIRLPLAINPRKLIDQSVTISWFIIPVR